MRPLKIQELDNPKTINRSMIVIQSSLVTCTKAKCPNKYQKMLPALKMRKNKTYIYSMGENCIKCPYREDQWQLVLDNVPWKEDQWQSQDVWDEEARKLKEGDKEISQ